MHFKKLDLNLLVALDALLSERSVSRASERLYLSQSATSGALARLREYFNDELLTPLGRQMVLTPLGESLALPVRRILQQIQETIETKPHFDAAASDRRFKFLVSDYSTTVFMAAALRRIQREAPGVKLDLLPLTDAPVEALDRGEVDFLIIPDVYATHAHPSELLFKDSFACAVWADNKEVGDVLSWEDYLRLGHIVVRFGRTLMPTFDEWFLNQYGYARRIEVTTGHFNNVPELLVGTPRIATLYKRLANLYASQLPLRLLEPPVEFPKLTEMLQWHTRADQDPALIWLRNLLRETAQQLSAS